MPSPFAQAPHADRFLPPAGHKYTKCPDYFLSFPRFRQSGTCRILDGPGSGGPSLLTEAGLGAHIIRHTGEMSFQHEG